MKTLPARIAGLSRRSKALLAAASALLIIVIVAGAVLALNPRLAARLTGTLAGAVAPSSSDFKLRPQSAGDNEVSLARSTWAFFNSLDQQGYYVGLYPWDAANTLNRLWNKETATSPYERIYTLSYYKDRYGEEYTKLYLSVRDASGNDGADVVAWSAKSTAGNDQWQFMQQDKDANGVQWWLIKNKNSGKCVDLRAGDNALVQQTCDGSKTTQKWRMIPKG